MHSILPTKTENIVLLLHGLGADGADLIGLGHEWKSQFPNTAFYAPDAPFPCDMAPMGYQWFSLQDRSPSVITKGLDDVVPVANKLIDEVLKNHALPANKLALCGFSQGTMLSLHAGLQRAEPLAGIIGYSGAFFLPADKIKSKPPILLTHGTHDTVLPVEASQIAAQQLNAAGIKADLHIVQGMGHGIDSACLDLGAKFLHRVLGFGGA